MCGIAGIFAYRESAPPVDEQELLRIREAMIRRGPDGAGLWISPDRRVGLAHRRLSIIDLSEAGAQPMATADGRYRITFNGEIYNYRELRKELEAKGYRFHSNSDTEVLLHLYADRAQDMVHALRGMYAFGIWDERRKGVFLARDPFGIKPFYYADDGRTFRFASQVKALLRSGAIVTTPDPAGQVGFFLWGSVPEPFTLHKEVRSLPAGAWLWVGAQEGHRGPAPFFSIAEELAKAGERNMDLSREHPLTALRESVRHHLVADVPVGVFLSAGLDSATMMALAAGEQAPDLRSLTLGFREYLGTENDETTIAATTASRYGARHETRWIERLDFESELDAILAAMDQPTIDGVNTYFVSRAAAESGMKVAMSGLGGDELLGGYPSFRDVPRIRRFATALGAGSHPAAGIMFRRMLAPLARQFTSPKYAGVLEYGGSYAGAYLLRRGLYMPWELPDLMDPDMAASGWAELQPLARLDEATHAIGGETQTVSALELGGYMRNQLLRDSDWAGMAHSLEIRVPYVDVPFFRVIAAHMALGRAPVKADLALALRPPLPGELIHRSKTGFVVPVREWCAETSAPGHAERGLRGWARLVMQRSLGEPGAAVPRAVFGPASPAHPAVSRTSMPPLAVLRQSAARRTLHRSQAWLANAAYLSVNGLLQGLAHGLWPGARPAGAERVCVFRIGNIGDIACALPAIQCVRNAYPHARLTLLTSPGQAGMPGARELLDGASWIDELRVYHADDIETPSKRWRLLREMRARRFDVWVEIPNNLSSVSRQFRDLLFTWMTGVGWARGWKFSTLHWAAQAQSEYVAFANEVDRTLDIVRRAGIPVDGVDFALPRPPAAQARIDELMQRKGLRDGQLVAIAPGAKRATNRWPLERFVEVGRALVDGNTAVVVLGGTSEARLFGELAARIGAQAHSMAGELTLAESCELLRRCRLLIAVDSGVQHLAAAVGTPCVSLFSFWQMRGRWHPYGARNVVIQKWVPCHTCLLEECPIGNACMNAIEVEEVVRHASRMPAPDFVS